MIGIAVPVAFTIGVAARKPVPMMDSLPKELTTLAQPSAADELEAGDVFAKRAVGIRLLRSRARTGQIAISFSAPKDFLKPDLIVYWVAGNSAISDTLPNDAILLGSFGATALPLPNEVMKAGGKLVLYSLADNEIVEVSKPVNVEGNQNE